MGISRQTKVKVGINIKRSNILRIFRMKTNFKKKHLDYLSFYSEFHKHMPNNLQIKQFNNIIFIVFLKKIHITILMLWSACESHSPPSYNRQLSMSAIEAHLECRIEVVL